MVVARFVENPELAFALVIILRVSVAYQRGLSWPEYRLVHSAKSVVFPLVDGRVPSVSLVNAKDYQEDAEYVLTHNDDVRGTWRSLVDAQGSPHLLCSLKQRETPEGNQYSRGHVVWLQSGGRQLEAYLFPSVDGRGTDVYVHSEASVLSGIQHLTSTMQVDGDPGGIVRNALGG